MDRHDRQKTTEEDYSHGVDLYARGMHREALEQLAPFRLRGDATGRVAQYYEGLSHRALGLKALSEGRFNAAEKYFRSAMKCLGTRSDLFAYLNNLYVRTGRHDRCEKQISRVADSRLNDSALQRRFAQVQYHNGKKEEAYLTLGAALRRNPDAPGLLMQMGLFLSAEDRTDQALAYFDRAAKADCTNPEAHRYLGLAYGAEGNCRAAVRAFERAWNLQPNDITLVLQLSVASAAAHQVGQRITLRIAENSAPVCSTYADELAGYVQREPEFVDAFLELPPAQTDRELFGALSSVLDKALREHPEYADLQLRQSRVSQRLGDAKKAMRCASKAVSINPNYVQGLLQLARLNKNADQFEEAIAYLQRAIDCGADYPDVHCLTGELLHRSKQDRQAGEHFRRALELKEDYTRAAEGIGKIAA